MSIWKKIIIAVVVIGLAFIIGQVRGYKRGRSAVIPSRVDTCTVYVTKRVYEPQEVAKVDLGLIPVPLSSLTLLSEGNAANPEVAPFDTLVVHDTMYVYLPREQKHYAQENLYDCWVSGVSVKLDSLNVYQKETTIRIPPPPRPLNSVSLRGSFVYAGQPCLPLMLTYGRELGPVTFRAGAGYDVLLRKPVAEIGAEISFRW